MMRPGLIYTAATIVLGLVTLFVVRESASEAVTPVTQLMVVAMIVLGASLAFGSSQVLAGATVPVLATVMVEAGFSDEPSWIRSLVIGCLWFATIEMGWEALDRRDGSKRTGASTARRIQEVSTVVILALVVGLLASIGTALAPVRSVLLQAVVLGLVLATFVMLLRRVAVVPADEA